MRQVRITVTPHPHLDVRGAGIIASAPTVGVAGVKAAQVTDLYFVRGELTDQDIEKLCNAVLADPAAHNIAWSESSNGTSNHEVVEVAFIPGVMDPLALQLIRAAKEVGLPTIEVATGTRYELDAPAGSLSTLAERLLYNATVQRYAIGCIDAQFVTGSQNFEPRVENISLDGLNDEALVALSKKRLLSLSADEMRTIQAHFATLGRAPTDIELEMLAQTWSEHCVHKTFKALIEYTKANGEVEIIDGLLKSTIRKATEEINAPWVRSAFVDNAGIIAFDDKWDLSFKAETHNHPSALEPFGGANTGVGGVIRDVMGVSARPIAVTDILCFGPQNLPFDQLPQGTLHPSRVKEGVVSGVQDYGNKLGIPTVSGAVYYDPGFTSNPLVFCGCVGIAPRNSHPTGARPGDRVIVLGGRTGRDGIHGATFSSDALAHNTGQVVGTAVQIGNPIVQKDVMEVLLLARDAKLYTAITDCGAGGLSSAVGEMAQHPGGVDVELSDVPLKYPGLHPWEIWLSEAQERMVIAIPPENWNALKRLCDDWDVEATDIGEFTNSGKVIVRYADKVVADMALDFIHDGLPRLHLKATATPEVDDEDAEPTIPTDPNAYLLTLLSDPNTATKEDVIHRYDHEVRSGTVIKPLIGVGKDGPSDGAVMKPIETPEHFKGFALGVGMAPEIGKKSPKDMAWNAIYEAVANIVAVGADPDQIALLDNFCWGDPKDPQRLGALVETSVACKKCAEQLGTPFISGKDSLNNTYIGLDGKRISIPDTLVISAIGIVHDVNKSISMDFKKAGNSIYILYPHFFPNHGFNETCRLVYQQIQEGTIVACHNVSEGGIAVALAEMCIAGNLGAHINANIERLNDPFGQQSAFILEAPSKLVNSDIGWDSFYYGTVTAEPRLKVEIPNSPIDLEVSELAAAFKRQGKYMQTEYSQWAL